MISIVRFILVGCAFLLSLDRVSGEEALTINLRDVSADKDKIYPIDLPSDGFLNFTAVRPDSSCSANGSLRANSSFSVAVRGTKSCTLAIWWGEGGAAFAKAPLEPISSIPTVLDIQFSLFGDTMTAIYQQEVKDLPEGIPKTNEFAVCPLRAKGNTTVNFIVKRSNAVSLPSECKEILFKFSSVSRITNSPNVAPNNIIVPIEITSTSGLENATNISTTIASTSGAPTLGALTTAASSPDSPAEATSGANYLVIALCVVGALVVVGVIYVVVRRPMLFGRNAPKPPTAGYAPLAAENAPLVKAGDQPTVVDKPPTP